MKGTGNGAISLISEFIVSQIGEKFNWNIPKTTWIEIPDNYPWVFGTDEFDDIVQKSYGYNLGIEYIPNSTNLPFERFYKHILKCKDVIYTIDLFFLNYDRTNLSSNFLENEKEEFYIIDNASLGLFSGFKSNREKLVSNHLFLLPEYQTISPKFLNVLNNKVLFVDILEKIPHQLFKEAQLSKEEMLNIITERITFFETGFLA